MSLATLTVIGVVVLAALTFVFLRVRRTDQIGALMEKRRPGSKVVSRADYVEGAERIPVAISLTSSALYYENPDLEASFDLNRVDEIEYSDELATGRTLEDEYRVLRVRSHGTAFEFVLGKGECDQWRNMLPPKTMGDTASQAV